MTALELLRSVGRDPLTLDDVDSLVSIIPLLAGLVDAVGDFMDQEQEDDVDANYQRVERAMDALNAAAQKDAK